MFDPYAKLAEIEGHPAATPATIATLPPFVADVASVATPQRSKPAFRVAEVASVATPLPRKLEITPRDSDPETFLDLLHRDGPTTYGAAAATLGWGATRAWQAEAKLRAAGLVVYLEGKAAPKPDKLKP